ncbi:MAG: MerR family transcriptional regulator [Pseudomonadota bacterium]|nr:MerR family transcriptional regulator [Pseudomonadota bacterium]
MAKGPEAFRTISEAATELGVAQHVLRFWETKFAFVRPMKRAGGRRFYRPHDIAILATVHRLLHSEGYTIKGVQKLHRERGLKNRALGKVPAGPDGPDRHGSLEESLAALEAAKSRLDALLGAR